MSLSYKILSEKAANNFITRHNGVSSKRDIEKALSVIGEKSIADLINKIVPADIRAPKTLNLPDPLSEAECLAEMRHIARTNPVMRDYIGQGYYKTITPPVILRNILENPAWYTSYTPYQPEISQGRLEALINFQTVVSDLTGLPFANASLLDEATAGAEAVTLCKRKAKNKANAVFVSENCHPQTIDVIKARCNPLNIEVIVGPDSQATAQEIFCAVLQYPGTDGTIIDYSSLIKDLKAKSVLVAVATDLLALTLLQPPGEIGADVAFGSSQRFGVPLGFGGPHAAFFAVADAYKRDTPGRMVGVSTDAHGRKAYRLALQTREQHIRREKATSTICTAQAVLALIAGMYATYHGPEGLKEIALRTHLLTRILAEGLKTAGFTLKSENYFDTITLETGVKTADLHRKAVEAGVNFRPISGGTIGISLDEACDESNVRKIWEIFAVTADFDALAEKVTANPDLPGRTSDFMTHPVFHSYRSETELMRYMRKLADKDLALDRTMIPLGSCTMKLNAASEMIPVTLPGFAEIHPFRPLDQVPGYLNLIETLEDMLSEITGFDAMSLQPNSGAAGEYAGLCAIRDYQAARGEGARDICLIPTSAHGTNPASAVMAGLRVVTVGCDQDGNIDMADLNAKVETHKAALSCLMITYPSTHGVYETGIKEICDLMHANGGQVYMDGANMNAQVALTSPGLIGADVCHLNLHKTFCIPHGGGGPGVGPIGVRKHLAPYLPGHFHLKDAPERHRRGGTVNAAAPFGSASILPIPYAYIRMTGAEGLKRATEIAILSANYIAKRLEGHYDILYKGENGYIAHECIIDTRPLKEKCGVTVDDVAKRLIDFGFHAPTMSWPVAGTLMIEPTESESLYELDRFCDAMIAIRREADAIERGEVTHENSPLARAPHTAESLVDDALPYSREQAVYPVKSLRASKYFPPGSRVDNAYGDRNLFCACPPIEDLAE